MRVDISFKYLQNNKIFEQVVDKNIKRLKRKLKMFKDDSPIHISGYIEKNPHREEYFAHLKVYLPSAHVLRADVREKDSLSVINKCFDALNRQLEKLKIRLEKHLRKKYRSKDSISLDEI